MRFSIPKLPIISILASLLIFHGCAHRLMDQDRFRLGTIGIVRADYTPELGLDTFAVGGAAGATKGAFSGLGACLYGASQAGIAGFLLAPFLCPAMSVYGIYEGANQAVSPEEAQEIDKLARTDSEPNRLQNRLSENVSRNLAEYPEYPFRVIDKGGPSEPHAKPDYRSLHGSGIDTVLETEILKLMLKGNGENPKLTVSAAAHYRLVQTKDNKQIERGHIVAESAPRKFSEWARNDAESLKGEIVSILDRLSVDIIEQAIMRTGYTLCPADRLQSYGTSKLQTLQPTLSWDTLSLSNGKKIDMAIRSISRITYELRVWKNGVGGREPAYERKGLTETKHRIEDPLEPSTVYAWTVRARFVLDNQTRLTSSACTPGDRVNYYHFETPEREK